MKKYYLHDGTVQDGPFDAETLKSKNLTKEAPVWFEGLDSWTTIGEVDELKEVIKIAPPPFTQKTAATPPPIQKAPVIEHKEIITSTQAIVEPKIKKRSLGKVLLIIIGISLLGIAGVYGYSEVEQQISTQKEDDRKAMFRNNINSYVTAEGSEYLVNPFGGISDLRITVANTTDYTIDDARVRVTYYKANGNVWKQKEFSFKSIRPNTSQLMRIPDTDRGTSLDYEMVYIKSSSLGIY